MTFTRSLRSMGRSLFKLKVPTIAVIDGQALGRGF